MPADDLIKTLPTQKHVIFVQQLNLIDISDRLICMEKVDNENNK